MAKADWKKSLTRDTHLRLRTGSLREILPQVFINVNAVKRQDWLLNYQKPHDGAMEKIIHTRASRIMTKLLRELRIEAELKQEDLAAKLGVPRQTISAIERGERMLMLLEIWQYLQPLGIKPSDFVARLETLLGETDAGKFRKPNDSAAGEKAKRHPLE